MHHTVCVHFLDDDDDDDDVVLPLQCNVIFTTSRDSVKQPPTHPRSQWFWRSDRVSSVRLSVCCVCMYVCMGKQLYLVLYYV